MPTSKKASSLFPELEEQSAKSRKPYEHLAPFGIDSSTAPLADRMRPRTLDEFVGQDHLLAPGRILRRLIEEDRLTSLIFWGPPGSGKTTLARVIANRTSSEFVPFSAVTSGIKEIRQVMKDAAETRVKFERRTVLFIDEIHRFNKAQQDAFLPYVENGTIVLVGATAENPSFHLNDALLSRMRVLTLNALNEQDLMHILERYEGIKGQIPLDDDARKEIIHLAQGDGRYLLNLVENILKADPKTMLNRESLFKLLQKRAPLFDRAGDQHYNLISALHKSVRGSDPDAAIYWMC